MEGYLNGLIQSERDKTLVALAFIYDEPSLAVRFMHDMGDESSAMFLRRVVNAFEPHPGSIDLSHQEEAATIEFHHTTAVATEAVKRMIEAYDLLRETERGPERPALREALSTLFDHREVLTKETTHGEPGEQLEIAWLDSPIVGSSTILPFSLLHGSCMM